MPRPTLKTVAVAAGVSTATVSNAYNRPDRLSVPVRARVFAVADELGYAGPDPAARSLRSRRVGAIGVLFTNGLSYAFDDPYCVRMLAGVAEVAERTRTTISLMPLVPRTAGLDAEQMRASVGAVQRAVVDGVLADGIEDDHAALQILAARGVPVVGSIDRLDGRCVVLDEFAAGRAVGEHLAALGHRHVAVLLDSPPTAGNRSELQFDALFPYARSRLAGVAAGLGRGARLDAVGAGQNSLDCGTAAAGLVLDQPGRPSAIAAVSDVLALGALGAARQRALEPGLDVSVTGFDDVPDAASAGLTTVAQPIREKGRLMARMLLEPDFDQRRIVLPWQFMLRTSTGPAR